MDYLCYCGYDGYNILSRSKFSLERTHRLGYIFCYMFLLI